MQKMLSAHRNKDPIGGLLKQNLSASENINKSLHTIVSKEKYFKRQVDAPGEKIQYMAVTLEDLKEDYYQIFKTVNVLEEEIRPVNFCKFFFLFVLITLFFLSGLLSLKISLDFFFSESFASSKVHHVMAYSFALIATLIFIGTVFMALIFQRLLMSNGGALPRVESKLLSNAKRRLTLDDSEKKLVSPIIECKDSYDDDSPSFTPLPSISPQSLPDQLNSPRFFHSRRKSASKTKSLNIFDRSRRFIGTMLRTNAKTLLQPSNSFQKK
jgi:hypothetical protein